MSPDSTRYIGEYAPANDNASPDAPARVIHRDHTFRVIVEDEETGEEYRGWSGLNRVATERVAALINHVGAHELALGELPKRVITRKRALERFALDVAHVFDRKPPTVAQPRRALTVKARVR